MREAFAEFVRKNLGSDTLLVTCGLPGTWKTETASEISKIKGYPILRTDLIRLEVFKKEDVFDEVFYRGFDGGQEGAFVVVKNGKFKANIRRSNKASGWNYISKGNGSRIIGLHIYKSDKLLGEYDIYRRRGLEPCPTCGHQKSEPVLHDFNKDAEKDPELKEFLDQIIKYFS